MDGIINQPIIENFTIVDESSLNIVTGLIDSDFSKVLIHPSGGDVADSVSVIVTETASGGYKAEYTPDSTGIWYLTIFNDTYCPFGKSGESQVYENSIDTVGEDLIRVLGLSNENYELLNTSFNSSGCLTSGTIRLFDSASNVGTANGIIAEYSVNATYSGSVMVDYQVKRTI